MSFINNVLNIVRKYYKSAAVILCLFFMTAFLINTFAVKKYYIRSIISFTDQKFPIENKSGYDFNMLATLKTELNGKSYVPQIASKYNISPEDIPSFKINMVKYLGSFEVSALISKDEFEKYSHHMDILLEAVKEKYLKRMNVFISKYKMVIKQEQNALKANKDKLVSLEKLQALLGKRKDIIVKKISKMEDAAKEQESLMELLEKKRLRTKAISSKLEGEFDLDDEEVMQNWLKAELLLSHLNKKIDGCLDFETQLERLRYELYTIENDMFDNKNAKKYSLKEIDALKENIVKHQEMVDYFSEAVVIQKPALDKNASSPKTRDNYVLAFLMGMIFIVMFVFIKEYFDNGVI